MSYFKNKAYLESMKIISNVETNLELCITARNTTKRQFIEWMKMQGMKETSVRKLDRYMKGGLDTDQLCNLCLTATYMNKTPQEVFFSVLPIKAFQAK